MNKFNIGQRVFFVKLVGKDVWVDSFEITNICHTPQDGVTYRHRNRCDEMPEKNLFLSRQEAYEYIINMCKNAL